MVVDRICVVIFVLGMEMVSGYTDAMAVLLATYSSPPTLKDGLLAEYGADSVGGPIQWEPSVTIAHSGCGARR